MRGVPGLLPRYIRRHGHQVMPVDWTVRSALPGRRERKIAAKIARIMVRRMGAFTR